MSDPEMRDRIRSLLASKRGAELIECLADEISDLHSLNQQLSQQIKQLLVYQKFMDEVRLLKDAVDRPAQLPNRLSINASEMFEASDGFYNLEYDPDGRPFRWTGPEKSFSLSVHVDRSKPLRLQIELAHIADKRQKEMLLIVDGASLPISLTTTPGGFVGETELLSQSVSRATNLVFALPCVVKPEHSSERRTLGVAFREIRINPAPERDTPAVSAQAASKPDAATSGASNRGLEPGVAGAARSDIASAKSLKAH